MPSIIYINIYNIDSYKSKIKIIKKYCQVQFSTPYGLNDIPWISDLGSIVISYQDSEFNQLATSKVLTGQIPALGVLPVSAAGYTAQ